MNNKTPIQKKDWGRILGLFLSAGEEGSARDHPVELGRAWLRTGRFEQALALLAPVEERQAGASLGRAGYAAYRLRDLDRAIALWKREPDLKRYISGYYAQLNKALVFLADMRDKRRR